jgi:hypothetical protein
MKAYSLFHNYSLSNQLAAMAECVERYVESKVNDTQVGLS